MKKLLVVTVAFAVSTPVLAADIEGLLSLPMIFAADAPEGVELKVRKAPSIGAPLVAVLRKDGVHPAKGKGGPLCLWNSNCPSLLHEKGERSLLVARRTKGTFFEVFLDAAGKKRGWIQSETRFRPLTELMQRKNSFLTESWDGALFTEPAGMAAIRMGKPQGGLIGVKVRGTEAKAGALWVEVDLFPVTACDVDGTDEASLAHGWVQAFPTPATPAVWSDVDCPGS